MPTTTPHQPAVVIVEDDEVMREYLGEVLTVSGCHCNAFPDGASALSHLSSALQPVDLILSDINMPGMSGLEFLRTVKAVAPDLPFILISGLCELATALDAVKVGATDYLLKPARRDDIVRLVAKHLMTNKVPLQQALSTTLSRFLRIRRLSGGNSAAMLEPLFGMLGLRRLETLQHSQRVARYSMLIGLEAGLDKASLQAIEIGALLHDIGKAGIPHNVLMKPASLDDTEWRVMRLHPVIGWELLSGIPGVEEEAQIVYSHHERYDGQGYPRALHREEIPVGARVFSIADTLDALLSDRPYRAGCTLRHAREEIVALSGTQFDPWLVACFDHVSDAAIDDCREHYRDELSMESTS
jgi:response regulator RpfG family c-di-GMP phosphodiesterase